MGVTPGVDSSSDSSTSTSFAAMDAIKKKMQAMKVEKDNAMDRSDVCEQASKDAKVRAAKAEEEVDELVKKSQQLEVELDKLKQAEARAEFAEKSVQKLQKEVDRLEDELM